MIKGDKLSGVVLCSQLGPVRNIWLHPRHYTCLLQCEKCLVYYDLFSLNTIWICESPSLSKLWMVEDPYRVAFTLDFNSIHICTNEFIYSLSSSVPRTHQIAFTGKSKVLPLMFASLIDRFLLVHDNVIIVQDSMEWQRYTLTSVGSILQQALPLNNSVQKAEISCLTSSHEMVMLIRIDVTTGAWKNLGKIEEKWTVQAMRVDEKHQKVAILTEARIEILMYGDQGLQWIQSIDCFYPIMDFLFFHFAENTDTVEQRYRQELLVTATNTTVEGCKLGLYTLPSSQPQILNIPRQTRSILFNPLFNNCLILLNSHGAITLQNMYGYDKEWVTLGFRFVSIETNEIYFEKENEFEFQIIKKKKPITAQDLDDDTYSIFSTDELKNFKRIDFQI